MGAVIFLIISTSGVNSLLLPASPLGVTASFSASQDVEAIFYNPANFEAGENFRLWCSYNRFYLDMQSVSLAVSKRVKSLDLGIAFLNFDYGDIEQHPDYPTKDSLIYYSANDFSIVLGGSVRITPQGRIGINLKYISESIHIYSDYVLAFDVSFSYTSEQSGISFGASNFGSTITLYNEQVNLPARISIGGFHSLKKVIPSVDLHYLVNNNEFEFTVGARFPISNTLSLDGAYHYREDFYPGFGVAIKPGKMAIRYAGAFYPKDLGMINTIGIGFEF